LNITLDQLRRIILEEIEQAMGGQTARLEITSSWDGQSIKDALFGENDEGVIDTSFGSVKLKRTIRIDEEPGLFQADISVLDASATDEYTLAVIREVIHGLIADLASGNPDAEFEVFVTGILS